MEQRKRGVLAVDLFLCFRNHAKILLVKIVVQVAPLVYRLHDHHLVHHGVETFSLELLLLVAL